MSEDKSEDKSIPKSVNQQLSDSEKALEEKLHTLKTIYQQKLIELDSKKELLKKALNAYKVILAEDVQIEIQ